jgi:hypothetical protein
MGEVLRRVVLLVGVAVIAVIIGGLLATSSVRAASCSRSVAAGEPEAALHAAFSDASDPGAVDCATWRVEVSGSHDLTESIEFTAEIDLEVVGPAGGTAVLQAVPAHGRIKVEHRILTAEDAESVRLERLVLTGGDVSTFDATRIGGDAGGAVLTDVLHLVDVELRANKAGTGGAVDVFSLEATRVSFLENEAELRDGRGGAVRAVGDVALTNVTFSGNLAKEGGAIMMLGLTPGGSSLDATFVTFDGNGATSAGSGAHLHLDKTLSSAVVRGSVLGGAAVEEQQGCGGPGSFAAVDWTGTFVVGTGCGVPGARVLESAPTFTSVPFRTGMRDLLAPVSGGPLIDVVDCGAGWPTADQRGVTRPQGGEGRCDAGAVEVEPRVEKTQEPEEEPSLVADQPPVPTRIHAGGGGCAAGCPSLTSDADAPARRR